MIEPGVVDLGVGSCVAVEEDDQRQRRLRNWRTVAARTDRLEEPVAGGRSGAVGLRAVVLDADAVIGELSAPRSRCGLGRLRRWLGRGRGRRILGDGDEGTAEGEGQDKEGDDEREVAHGSSRRMGARTHANSTPPKMCWAR